MLQFSHPRKVSEWDQKDQFCLSALSGNPQVAHDGSYLENVDGINFFGSANFCYCSPLNEICQQLMQYAVSHTR